MGQNRSEILAQSRPGISGTSDEITFAVFWVLSLAYLLFLGRWHCNFSCCRRLGTEVVLVLDEVLCLLFSLGRPSFVKSGHILVQILNAKIVFA